MSQTGGGVIRGEHMPNATTVKPLRRAPSGADGVTDVYLALRDGENVETHRTCRKYCRAGGRQFVPNSNKGKVSICFVDGPPAKRNL